MPQMCHLPPHYCSVPMSRRYMQILFLCCSTRATPSSSLQRRKCSSSQKQEKRLVGLSLSRNHLCSRSKILQVAHGYWNKASFQCKSCRHHACAPFPPSSLLHSPDFLSKRAFVTFSPPLRLEGGCPGELCLWDGLR